jgi:hypothetical protein
MKDFLIFWSPQCSYSSHLHNGMVDRSDIDWLDIEQLSDDDLPAEVTEIPALFVNQTKQFHFGINAITQFLMNNKEKARPIAEMHGQGQSQGQAQGQVTSEQFQDLPFARMTSQWSLVDGDAGGDMGTMGMNLGFTYIGDNDGQPPINPAVTQKNQKDEKAQLLDRALQERMEQRKLDAEAIQNQGRSVPF